MYTADPYHALAPAASYGVGAVVSGIFFLVLFLISSLGYQIMKLHPEKPSYWWRRSLVVPRSYVCVCALGKEPDCRRPVITWSCMSPTAKETRNTRSQNTVGESVEIYQGDNIEQK